MHNNQHIIFFFTPVVHRWKQPGPSVSHRSSDASPRRWTTSTGTHQVFITQFSITCYLGGSPSGLPAAGENIYHIRERESHEGVLLFTCTHTSCTLVILCHAHTLLRFCKAIILWDEMFMRSCRYFHIQ